MIASTTGHPEVPSGQAPAISFDHLDASYGPYRALFDLSFEVAPGSVKALLGSNGAGKSTVARVATGLLSPSSGTVTVGGVDVSRSEAYRIARLGVAHVPEGRGIFASLTVEENLTLVFRQRLGRRRVGDAIDKAYDAFPILKDSRHKRGGNLSGGQQRLLSLAAVLLAPPKLLVADELSLGLAPVVIDAVYDGLRQIHEAGTALLIVEQQIDRVLDLADEAIVLDCGTLAYDGPADGAGEAMDGLLASRGEHNVLADHLPAPIPERSSLDPPPRHSGLSSPDVGLGPIPPHVGNGSTL
jgi:branched-chain amino acid transport system ATP-binding protein